jgi:hypothetical protein
MDPRTALGDDERRKSSPTGTRTPTVQPVTSHYTDCAIPSPLIVTYSEETNIVSTRLKDETTRIQTAISRSWFLQDQREAADADGMPSRITFSSCYIALCLDAMLQLSDSRAR